MILLSGALVAILLYHCVEGSPLHSQINEELSLRILHTNDMHARFEETSKYSSRCTKKEAEQKKCYGGFARLATLIRQARNSSIHTLFLNAGDNYQGTIWYSVHKWKIVSKFMNLLEPDVISLGNHEFDDGVKGLVPFLKASMFPVVAANLNLDLEPSLNLPELMNSTIVEINGTKVGVIGYVTPETKSISSPENVVFLDEITAIREEVAKLKAKGVKILIALGHSGFSMDKKIAREVEDIDLVIGGHTNTFLYNGKWPDSETPDGLYPTEIVQENGRKVYVVQAYAYTKYLGDLYVKFNKNGEITSILGTPILVNGQIEQAPDILKELDKWRKDIDQIIYKPVGSTKVFLDGSDKSCRLSECNLGNLITDSMIDYNVRQKASNDSWTDAAIAVHNAGSIRSSITRDNNNQITMADVLTVLPFGNVLFAAKLTGEKIMKMLEWSVEPLKEDFTSDPKGSYLQVSGLHVTYDISKPPMSRVVSVQVLCSSCRIPNYFDLEKNSTYTVLMTDFIYHGGDGYDMFEGSKYESLGVSIDNVLAQYLNETSPVYPAIEGRISYDAPGHNSGLSLTPKLLAFLFGLLAIVMR